MATVSSVALWFSKNSGQIQIEWLGWEVNTSLSIFILITFITLFTISIVFMFFYKFLSLPFKIKNNIKKHNIKKANHALEEGLLASVYGEKEKILKTYAISKKYLNESPLLLLLKLQNNLIKGNESECFNTYKKMLNFHSSRPIAIRGLIVLATKNNDKVLFSNMLRSAATYNISIDYFINEAFYFCIKNDSWKILKEHASSRGKRKNKNLKNILGFLNYNLARKFYENGNLKEANNILKEIFSSNVFLPPTVDLFSRLNLEISHRSFKKILKSYWLYFPHYNILDCVLRSFNNLSILKKVSLLIELLEGHDELYLKYLLLGEIKAKAKIWGDSRKDLLKSIKIFPTKKAYLLLVDIEEQTSCNKDKIKEWLKLADNYQDKLWKCKSCYSVQKEWNIYCENCNNLLTFSHQGFKGLSNKKSDYLSNNSSLKIA